MYVFKGLINQIVTYSKSMIVLFHENVLLLSTYKFIVIQKNIAILERLFMIQPKNKC